MIARSVVLILIAAVTLGHAVRAAGNARLEPPTASVAEQRKAIKCRKGRVAIRVDRHTVGCRKLRAALPPPRAGDSRLLLARSALDDDLRGLRDRHGRRAPSLKRLAHKVGPRAYRTLRRAIPNGLRRLDRLRATRAAAAQARPKCAGGTPTISESHTSHPDGQKLTATMTLGNVGGLDLKLEDGGYRIELRMSSDQCDHFEAPGCPTADGVVEATDSSINEVAVKIAKGDTVLLSRSFAYEGSTRMRAQVAPNADLDWIDIDDTQTANIEIGGTDQHFGPVQLLYTGIHHARVDMPGGNIAPDLSAVDITLTTGGVTAGRSELGAAATSIANDVDAKFAKLAAAEIARFKSRETGWKDPRTRCVDVSFSPASLTLKLRRGQRGEMSAKGVAAQDGGPVNGTWTLATQANASFAPAQVVGAEPHFSYEVSKAGKGVLVSVTARVTSRAGVGEASWQQETEDKPVYRGTIRANRGITSGSGECSEGWDLSYSARLADVSGADQPFPVIDGGAQGYDETGSGTYTLTPCNGLPGCSSSLFLDPALVSHAFVVFSVDTDTVGVEADAMFGGSCGFGSVVLGLGSFPRGAVGDDTIVVPLSFNSAPVYGNGTLTLTRAL